MSSTIKPIQTEEKYKATLRQIESLMATEAGTPEADKLEMLAISVERYEKIHFLIGLPDLIDQTSTRWLK